MAPPNRQGGSGLSLRTLVIASLASATAAAVVSRVFPPGTVYASALTPVIVAAVSEFVGRPVDRVSELARERRTLLLESRRTEAARVLGEEPNPLRGAPEWAQGSEAEEELATANGDGGERSGDVRFYGSQPRRRILHPKVWIVTGLVAFVIAAAALTLPELIFGGAVASNHQTTLFGGSTHSTRQSRTTTTTTPKSTGTQTSTVPSATPTNTTPTGAQTTPTSTTPTGTSTTPASGGAPAPTTTTPTSTGPAPPQP